MAVMSNTGRKFFNGDNITASNFIYTAAEATGADDGWITCKSNDISIAWGIATLVATTIILRVEGRFDTYNRAASLFSQEYTAVTTIDKVITIDQKLKEVRVGVKIDDADRSASPNNFYAGICMQEST